jgi:hypothetical protein
MFNYNGDYHSLIHSSVHQDTLLCTLSLTVHIGSDLQNLNDTFLSLCVTKITNWLQSLSSFVNMNCHG